MGSEVLHFPGLKYKIIQSVMIGLILSAFASASPEAKPGIFSHSLADQAGDLIDKIPSVEFSVNSDGLKVSTGPSREDVYMMVVYIIIAVIAVIVLLTLFFWCCCRPRQYMSNYSNRCIPVVELMPHPNPLVIAAARLNSEKVNTGFII